LRRESYRVAPRGRTRDQRGSTSATFLVLQGIGEYDLCRCMAPEAINRFSAPARTSS